MASMITTQKMPRLVEPESIPLELWDPSHPPTAECSQPGCLRLPDRFTAAYNSLLSELGLMDRACVAESTTVGGATGGDGGFEEHFSRRFSGSAARVQLYALDPRLVFSTTSDALFTLFAGGSIRILDVPFGAGAASAVLLSVVAELRSRKVLPSNPTYVTVIGGDIDEGALRTASKLFDRLYDYWLQSGLHVSVKSRVWDASSDESTMDLIDDLRSGFQSHERCATIIANFSGYLCEYVEASQCRRFEEIEYTIRHLLLASAKLGGTVFWIESKEKHVPNLFKWLQERIVAKYKRMRPAYSDIRHDLSTARSPVAENSHFTARCCGAHWSTDQK